MPSEAYMEATLAFWTARQPVDVPEGWEHDGTSMRRTYGECDSWVRFVPRIPEWGTEFAWRLEHEHHFYGRVVPLVRRRSISIFSAGGLLFGYFSQDEPGLRVALPGVSLDELLDRLAEDRFGPTVPLEDEWSVRQIATRYWRLWDWERKTLGRSRWQELKDRGGDVHPDRIENIPERLPGY